MVWFRILFGIDCLAAAVLLVFFFLGLLDGTVSEFNILLWMALLGGTGAVIGGSLWLNARGYRRHANKLLFVLAFPTSMIGVFFLALIILHPRWN